MPPRFTDLTKTLPASVPFVGPETQERACGRSFATRLGANECVFGPSPATIDAMRNAAPDIWMYGDPENYDLKTAIADHHGISPENIVVGEGIDGLLGLTVRLFVDAGDPVVTSAGAYPTFNYHVAGFGGTLHTVPYDDDYEDPDALITAAKSCAAKLIYIANPDNPMGTAHGADVIQGMIDRVPGGSLLCLDEAYIEFAGAGIAPPIDVDDQRVIRFRTFSKAYGMAGARIGYVIAEREIASSFNKVRNHFGVSRIAQAGALAALSDQTYLRTVVQWVADARERIGDIARDNGLSTVPSQTNFVAIDCGRDGDFARRVLDTLLARDVFARMPGVSPLDRCIRISAGREDDLKIFAEALPSALKDAS